ncbi:hypothetical protein [Desertivirga arenae]|uniref:hypothetical protein n=1 Tax=Desertivirga arenae TaxID=2810309 RepID=UPI001A96AE0A|nr:hypothetical protein [Pedobacter sp. SYSU D00823]
MNFQSLKRSLVSVFKNIPGKRIGRKILVIEADDWGSIRMPSKKAFANLVAAGIPVDKSRYGRNDALERSEDLEALFNVLSKHTDQRGRKAVISPFCNMANPDFGRIKENGYQVYEYETFEETYGRYGSTNMMNTWKQGITANLFVPQFHGREHIATELWLKALRMDDKRIHIAFENEYASFSPAGFPAQARDFRPNFYIESESGLQGLKRSLEEGIDIFKAGFKCSPDVFNAPNAVFVPSLNSTLIEKGIRFNAVPHKRLERNERGAYEHKNYVTGQESSEGLKYYVRNCNFEPSEGSYKGISHVLSQIQGAFLCGKAAVVGTHRVNFVGGLNEANRKHGINELDNLLFAVVKRWPDVEFMSSKEFSSLL